MGTKIVENYENLTDEEIVSLIFGGNYELMGVIIKRYYHFIVSYISSRCPKGLWEDAIQEANLALYGAVKSFEPDKSTFSAFAGMCIKRSVISFLRLQSRKKSIPIGLVTTLDDTDLSDSNSPEKIFFDKNDYQLLTDSIKLELSPLEYKVLQLYISGYRYSVIADRLSLSEKSVSNAMLRIRKKLKQ